MLTSLLRRDKDVVEEALTIVHLIRNSLDFSNWKERKALAAALKPIYTAPSAEAAEAELDALSKGRGARNSQLWLPVGAALGRR